MTAFTEGLPEGKGILPKLVNDGAMRRIESILTKVDEGRGDLGLLINKS